MSGGTLSSSTSKSMQESAIHTSSPSLPNRLPPPPPVIQSQWPELAQISKYLTNNHWHQAPIPLELTHEPEGVTIPEKLRQILIWSTWRPEDFPKINVPSIANTQYDEPEAAQGSEPETHPTEAKPDPPQIDIKRALSVRDVRPGNGPEVASLKSRLQKLRQSIVSSTDTIPTKANPPKIQAPPPPATGECISCFDEFPKTQLVKLKCLHEYCRPCLKEVIFNAMKTESAFPPKCCLSEISLPTVLQCLDTEERKSYKAKAAEYSIPAAQRWYCPNTACTEWIRPEKLHRNRKEFQTCPHCKIKICSTCRAEAHDQNQDCPQDFGLEATLEIAESEGWRRCYSCRTMVELTTGCRHITCKCGAQFCYVCCAVWKTCGCTEEDKVRRIQELQQKRQQRDQQREEADAAALAEEEEIAQAIAQVEEMERREAEERAIEEQRRQEEEEELLATLESIRLEEEKAKRDAIEQAERQYRHALRSSCLEECQIIRDILQSLTVLQQKAIVARHSTSEQVATSETSGRERALIDRINTVGNDMERIIHRRKTRCEKKQQEEFQTLSAKLEEEEDTLFLQLHMHLRDKPNREVREAKMRAAFQDSQQAQMKSLRDQQDENKKKLEMANKCDRTGILKWADNLWEDLKKTDIFHLQKLGLQIGTDRQWFDIVIQRRLNMIDENERLMLQELDNEQEVLGLTLERARYIEPSLSGLSDALSEASGPDDRQNIQQRTPVLSIPSTRSYVTVPMLEDPDMYGTSGVNKSPIPRSVPIELPTGLSVDARETSTPARMPLTPPGSSTPISIEESSQPKTTYLEAEMGLPGSFPLSPRNSTENPKSNTSIDLDASATTGEPMMDFAQATFYANQNTSDIEVNIPTTPPRSIYRPPLITKFEHDRRVSEISAVSSMSGIRTSSYMRSGNVSPVSTRNSFAHTLSPVSSIGADSTPPTSSRMVSRTFRNSQASEDAKRSSASTSGSSHSGHGKKHVFGSLLTTRKKIHLADLEMKTKPR